MLALHGLTYNLNCPNNFKNKFQLPHLSSNLNSLNHQKPDCFFGSLNYGKNGKNPQHLAPGTGESFIDTIRNIGRKISPTRAVKNSSESPVNGPVKNSDTNSLRERLSPSQQAALQKVVGPSPRNVIRDFITNLNSTESVSTLNLERCKKAVQDMASTWIEKDKKKLEKAILKLFIEKEWPLEIAEFITQPLK